MEFEPLQYHSRYTERSAVLAFQKDVVKALIELITNSVDSYQRLHESKEFEIKISYWKNPDKKYSIYFKDFAEGVNYSPTDGSKSFPQIMEVGAPTSGYDQADVRGFHGVGLKDVLVAWSKEIPEVISIRDNKLTHIKFVRRKDGFGCLYVKKDAPVTQEDRKTYGLKENGFIIYSTIPKDWVTPKMDTLIKRLSSHRELRKILESKKFKITIESRSGAITKQLEYKFPKGDVIDSGTFKIPYKLKGKYRDFLISYSIKLSEKDLSQKPRLGIDRDGGLLVYHGDYSVLDLTLFDYDNSSCAKRLFGEIHISGEKEDMKLLLEEGLIDEKRRGLLRDNKFNIALAERMNEILKKVTDKIKEGTIEERVSLSQLADIKDYIARFNALINTELEVEELAPIEQWEPPNGLGFFPSRTNLEIKEFEKKKIYLKAIKNKLPQNAQKIMLSSDNPQIQVKPTSILLNRDKILAKVSLYSETVDASGRLRASCDGIFSEINVKVIKNDKLHVPNGFDFVPSEQTIVNKREKAVSLIIDANKIDLDPNEVIRVSSSNNNVIKILNEKYSINKNGSQIIKNIHEIKISLRGKGVGKEAIVTANCSKGKAELNIKVVEERERKPHGLLRDIEPDPHETGKDISRYEDGVVYIHLKHPVIRLYMKKDETFMDRLKSKDPRFSVLLCKIIAQKLCEVVAEKKVEKVILDPADKYDEIKGEYDELYYKLGPEFHTISSEILDIIARKT